MAGILANVSLYAYDSHVGQGGYIKIPIQKARLETTQFPPMAQGLGTYSDCASHTNYTFIGSFAHFY